MGALQICALTCLLDFAYSVIFRPELSWAEPLLSTASAVHQALHTLPDGYPRLQSLQRFNGFLASKVELPVFVVAAAAVLGSDRPCTAVGLRLGRFDGWPLAWAIACVVLSTLAMVGWSYWVRGDHGDIQNALGPVITPKNLLVFAVVNASLEEIEARMLLLGSMIAGEAATASPWIGTAIILVSVDFGLAHYSGGFPEGTIGFILVFVWAVFLGIIRWWAGGMALILLLHVQVDAVIYLVVMLEERRRNKTRG